MFLPIPIVHPLLSAKFNLSFLPASGEMGRVKGLKDAHYIDRCNRGKSQFFSIPAVITGDLAFYNHAVGVEQDAIAWERGVVSVLNILIDIQPPVMIPHGSIMARLP